MPPARDASRNAARRNGKGWKKKPGTNPKAATGRTRGGYSPAALERRALKRAATKKAV